jgi:hypothetical protein
MRGRTVVNVATGRYRKGQERLVRAMLDRGEEVNYWTEQLPRGSPSHQDKPYAFKARALEICAERGFDRLLWCDASVVPLQSLDPIWCYAAEHGAWISKNWWPNGAWTSDASYADLFPLMSKAKAVELNENIWHVAATCFALDLGHPTGRLILEEYSHLALQTNAFKGPWKNDGSIGPATTLGHRHDQTALSVLAHRFGVPLTDPPAYFAYPPNQTDKTILLAAGVL